MGGRAVECTGLENRSCRKATVGSNPTPSARVGMTTVEGFGCVGKIGMDAVLSSVLGLLYSVGLCC